MGDFMGGSSTQQQTITRTPGSLTSQEQNTMDSIFESLGFAKNAQGKYEKAGATGTEQKLSALADTFESSFSADYADPQLEADLANQEQQIRAELSANLGPDYANTTSGIQALAKFNADANDARTAAKVDRESTMGGLASQTLQTLSNTELSGANTLSGLFGMAGDIRSDRSNIRSLGSTHNRPGGLDYLAALAGPAGMVYLGSKMGGKNAV